MVIISLLWKISVAKIAKSISFRNNCDKNIEFYVKKMTSGEALLAQCHYSGGKMQNRSMALHIKMNIYIPLKPFLMLLNLPVQECRAVSRNARRGSSPQCGTIRAAAHSRQAPTGVAQGVC